MFLIPEHSIISSKRDIEEKTAPFGGRKKGLFVAGKKALFVFNPFSGKGWIKHNLFEVIDLLVKQGYEVEVRPTQKRLDAYEVILNKMWYNRLRKRMHTMFLFCFLITRNK